MTLVLETKSGITPFQSGCNQGTVHAWLQRWGGDGAAKGRVAEVEGAQVQGAGFIPILQPDQRPEKVKPHNLITWWHN